LPPSKRQKGRPHMIKGTNNGPVTVWEPSPIGADTFHA